jgi:hypothetical protein
MGMELKVAFWVSGTPEQFILHVRSAIHARKQMEHDVKFLNTEEAIATVTFGVDIRKDKYAQVCTVEKRRRKGTQEKAYLLPLSP